MPTLLQRKVGASGTIVGIDESEQMLQVATERVAEHGWNNVHLLAAPVVHAPIESTADAALFCAVHDVLQSAAALDHICVPARRWPRPAGSGQPRGIGRWGHGWQPCMHRSSTISPASTGPGSCWPSSPPTCESTSWPSPPDTSRSATPGTARHASKVQGLDAVGEPPDCRHQCRPCPPRQIVSMPGSTSRSASGSAGQLHLVHWRERPDL
jgi:methyltransferase family protein